MLKQMLITVIAVAVIISGYFWLSRQRGEKYAGSVEKVTIGISSTSLLPCLIHIAHEKGFFLNEGVDMEIKGYPAGKFALAGTFDGEVDMCTVADPPIVFNSFKRDDFAVFATILDSAQHAKVLARKDRNINTAKDLIGKKVATTKWTTSYFFMSTFFIFNGLELSDVELVDLKPKEMVSAITSGDVDAVFAWEPNILNAKKTLGGNAIILPSKVGYTATFNLLSKKAFIKDNPQLLKRILKALAKAEAFVRDNRKESIDIIASRLKTDTELVDMLWDGYTFRLSLAQSLLIILEDQARWAIKNNLVDIKEVPNYLDYIHVDALEQVVPQVVTIIR